MNAASGSAYTVAGVGNFDDLSLTMLNDDLTLPPAGPGRARVIQAAASEPQLDISLADRTRRSYVDNIVVSAVRA